MSNIKYQFQLIQAIRNFFNSEGFLDVLTPPVVENPGMESHIHPFEVRSKVHHKNLDTYLHTSPEFAMKELLTNTDLEKIFTISYCFRDEPSSPIHRNQFLMLEWYRKFENYEKIMKDTKALISFCYSELKSQNLPMKNELNEFKEVTVDELFLEYCGFSILDFLDKKDLKRKIELDHKEVPMPSSDCAWDDYFFLIFLNLIEPHFTNFPFLLVKEFPAPLAALSTLKPTDPRVCERFEVYMNGVELCNCFNEITDKTELTKRFEFQRKEKKDLYGYELPWPERFMQAMDNYPKSSGIALGVERLLLSLVETKSVFFN